MPSPPPESEPRDVRRTVRTEVRWSVSTIFWTLCAFLAALVGLGAAMSGLESSGLFRAGLLAGGLVVLGSSYWLVREQWSRSG
ncbi:hypothetical protein ACNS7O_04820 [Haloferacaceae archaeon DSL9]